MIETAEVALFVLPWWSYLGIAATVIVSMAVVAAGDRWFEERRTRGEHTCAETEHACMVLVGTDATGLHQFCGQLCGHAEPHGEMLLDIYRPAALANDGEEIRQRFGDPDDARCWKGSSDGVCDLPLDHTGPHQYLCF